MDTTNANNGLAMSTMHAPHDMSAAAASTSTAAHVHAAEDVNPPTAAPVHSTSASTTPADASSLASTMPPAARDIAVPPRRDDFIRPDEVLSLPPPPSHPDMDDAAEPPQSRTASTVTSTSLPTSSTSTAAKASSAAFSLAAAAKSRLAQGGRRMLSPLVHAGSSGATNRSASSDKLASAVSQSAVLPPAPIVTSSNSNTTAPLSVATISYGIASLPGAAASSLGSLLFTSPPSSNNSANCGTGICDTNETAANAAAADAAAIAAADELRTVSNQQRMQILEDLVQSRRADWNYLKAMHAGTNYWLNVALLREQQVLAYVGERPAIRRSVQFFYLGLGLGRILRECTHAPFLALDGCQLLEELEFYFASATVQGMKLMVASSSSLHEPVAATNDDERARYALHEPFRPTLYKWNQRPVFRRLATPPIPFALDYREVLLSLCDILALVYSRFVADNSSSERIHVFHAILRFDDRIKRLVIEPVKKEFSAVALHVLAEEMASVRKLYGAHADVAAAPAAATAATLSPLATSTASSSATSPTVPGVATGSP